MAPTTTHPTEPWAAEPISHYLKDWMYAQVVDSPERGRPIAYVPALGAFDTATESYPETERMAQRLAAVPALVAALQTARWYVYHVTHTHTTVCDCDPCRELRSIDAVIARASGAESLMSRPDACPRCGHDAVTGVERYEWAPDGTVITVQFRCWDCQHEWSQVYQSVRVPVEGEVGA